MPVGDFDSNARRHSAGLYQESPRRIGRLLQRRPDSLHRDTRRQIQLLHESAVGRLHGQRVVLNRDGKFHGLLPALGAIGGASIAARYGDRWPLGRSLTRAYLIDALLFIPVVLVSNIWLAAFFWASSNALANFEIAQIIGFRMRVTPEHMVGRLMGAVRLLVLAGMAPSVTFFGWVADHRSPHVAMSIACVGTAVVAIAAFLTPAIRNESR